MAIYPYPLTRALIHCKINRSILNSNADTQYVCTGSPSVKSLQQTEHYVRLLSSMYYVLGCTEHPKYVLCNVSPESFSIPTKSYT